MYRSTVEGAERVIVDVVVSCNQERCSVTHTAPAAKYEELLISFRSY